MSAFQGTVLRTLRTKKILAAAVLTAQFSAAAFAADTTYTGAATGTWNVAGNWNNGAPTAGNNTFVDNGAAGNVNISVTATATTGTLNISAGDQVTINNNVFLSLNGAGTIAMLNNAGRLVVDSGANASQFRFLTAAGTGVGTITGGGSITMNGPLASITGTNLTNVVNVNNYIHGQGGIGGDALRFDNRGTIVADVNGGTLTIDPDSSGTQFINTGALRATNGGILTLNTGIFTNTGGMIDAQNGSVVNVQSSASVVGGTITTSGTGKVGVPTGQNGFFTDVVNNGAMFSDNNSDFGVANSFVNNGTIRLNSGASATDLEIQNDVSLSGNGQLIMSGNLAGINGIDDRRLTNGANHTIRGQGSIGQVGIWVTNNGLIDADVNGASLTLSADGTAGANAFINTGTMRATNGGTLVLNGLEGDFANTGGLVEAQAGSQVHFVTNAVVRGGTLSSRGTGILRVTTGQNAFFENVVVNGLFVSENNSDWGASVAITNNGTISLDAGANATDFEIQNDVMLSGPGHLIMNGALAGINGVDDRRLTNASTHTIRGQGSIGQVGIWVTNNGTIAADVNGATLTLSADGTAGGNAFINTGRLIGTNGGILSLSGAEGGYNNTGGTIEAQNGSAVTFVSNASILGGTFVSTGTGVFRVSTGNAVLLNDITLNGTLIAENNSNIQTFGPIVNNGTIQINSGTNSTFLNVRAPTLLDGTGQLILSGTLASAAGFNDQRLTNGPSHTIRGQGSVGGTEIWVTNNGTILADVNGGSITLAADGTAGANAFINDGTLRATNGATIQFGPSEGGFSGLGTVIADANSNVRAAGVSANQGQVIGEGTFTNQGGSNFTATHYRVSNLIITGAATRVRAGGGTLGTSQVSNLSISGAGGGLDLADHDLALDYTGASPIATVRGWLTTGRNNGNWNGVGINSSIAQAAAPTPDKTGLGYVEATDIFTSFPANFRGVSVDSTTVLVAYALNGDSNLDRIVDIGDFARVAANFNLPSNWFNGDFNYSGTTEIGDFALLAANFNKSLPAELPRGSSVPEPGALAVLSTVAVLKRIRRRRAESV